MKTVTLTPKTQRGKNKIREAKAALPEWDGETWHVIERRAGILFAPHAHGLWQLAVPNVAKDLVRERLSRWIHTTDDADFVTMFSI